MFAFFDCILNINFLQKTNIHKSDNFIIDLNIHCDFTKITNEYIQYDPIKYINCSDSILIESNISNIENIGICYCNSIPINNFNNKKYYI